MRTEWKTFLPLVVFFLVTTPAYGILTSWREPIGVVALVLTAATVGMMTLYFYIQSKTIGPRPEDRADGEVADGVGELGYPAKSIWPLWVALTLAVIALRLRILADDHGPRHGQLVAVRLGLRVLQGRLQPLSRPDAAARVVPSGAAGGARSSARRSAPSPAGVQRPSLVVACRALDPHHGLLVELPQAPRAGVRAGRADARGDPVEQVLHAGTIRVEVHPGS
jgi:hypothetical protein